MLPYKATRKTISKREESPPLLSGLFEEASSNKRLSKKIPARSFRPIQDDPILNWDDDEEIMNSRTQQRPPAASSNITMPLATRMVASAASRTCLDCTKKPVQVQCLHCSQFVCMECAQKHVNLAQEQIDVAQHLLNDKLQTLDRIAQKTKERIVTERDKIVRQADAERDRSFIQLAQIIEHKKQELQNKNKELGELPLHEIPGFIQQMTSDLEHLTDTNARLFRVSSTEPKINVQY